MSPFISTSLLLPSHSAALACLAMPSSSGQISSPLLAPKGQLVMKHSTAVLPVLLFSIVVLLASSCEARGHPVHVHGKVGSSTSKSHRLPGKDVAADGWLSRQMVARHMMPQHADAKVKEGMKIAAVAESHGAVRATPTPAVVTVSQRLSQREDTGFHLDYDGPRTHTPSHN